MVKSRKDSRIEIWSDNYINNTKDCRREVDKDVDIVQIEHGVGGGSNYMVEIADKKNPEEEKKSHEEDNALIFATGKLSAIDTIVTRLKAECDDPNRNWYGTPVYSEIRGLLVEIREGFQQEVDKATTNVLHKS